jgi:hypothetical protein
MEYSPFAKPVESVVTADLVRLLEVSEGWYVEYKQQLPKPEDIAKSISAFANHYGGWLFIGVQEADKNENKAKSAPGLPSSSIASARARISDSAEARIQPTPMFTIHVLEGPNPEMGLAEDHAVIVVFVPMGQRTPYIHSSGRVYRRVGDRSTPVEESNRNVLDELWSRSARANELLTARLNYEFEYERDEREDPRLYLHLLPERLLPPDFSRTQRFQEFADLIREGNRGSIGIPFDSIFPTGVGFMARQLGVGNPFRLGLTWETQHNLSTTVSIPIPTLYGRPGLTELDPEIYTCAAEYASLLDHRAFDSCLVANLSTLPLICCAITGLYRRLLLAEQRPPSVFAKVALVNARHCVPFFDSKEFVAHARGFGVPVVQERRSLCPVGSGPESLIHVMSSDDTFEDDDNAMARGIRIVPWAFEAFGVPMELWSEHGPALFEASERVTLASTAGQRGRSRDATSMLR